MVRLRRRAPVRRPDCHQSPDKMNLLGPDSDLQAACRVYTASREASDMSNLFVARPTGPTMRLRITRYLIVWGRELAVAPSPWPLWD